MNQQGSHQPVKFTRVYTPRITSDRSITRSHTQLAEIAVDEKRKVDLTAEAYFSGFSLTKRPEDGASLGAASVFVELAGYKKSPSWSSRHNGSQAPPFLYRCHD